MKTFYQLSLLGIALFLFSCDDTELRTDISREDLIGIWRQKTPDTLHLTGENGVKSIWVGDEYYHINSDLTFELTGQLLLRTGTNGYVKLSNDNKTIDFTLIAAKTNLPNGGTIQILKNQYWTWNVKDLNEGILEVECFTKDQNDSTLVVSTARETFIKQ